MACGEMSIAQLFGYQEPVRPLHDDRRGYLEARHALGGGLQRVLPTSGNSCFDTAHATAARARVPAPPERITGKHFFRLGQLVETLNDTCCTVLERDERGFAVKTPACTPLL
jgi:hypothetical protein